MPRVSVREKTATKQRLVEAAKSEFAQRGLAGARFDEISRAAGFAKGTIYNYFDSKEALFFTIVAEWCAALLASVDFATGLTAREQLLEIARLDVEIASKDPDLAAVIIYQMPALSGTHRSAADAALAPGIDALSLVIAAGINDGEFSDSFDAHTFGRLFLAALSAIEQEALAGTSAIGLDDVVPVVDRHFIAGLLA